MANISNSQDILDSRDIEERINELESEIQDLKDELAEEPDARIRTAEEIQDDIAELKEELKTLVEFRDQVGHPDWPHGLILVRDSYWEDFARDEADSLYGKEISAAHWPFDCIDWERAAEALQMDYSQAEYDGVTYYYRS